MRLFWRIFLVNAAVLTAATAVLALTPATVSQPIRATEVAVLAAGLAVLLAAGAWLLRRTLAPFERLVGFVRAVDPLRPGARLEFEDAGADLRTIAVAVNDMLDRLETERRESASRQARAQEDERRRVARELHDEVGQLLTAALLQLDHLELQLEREDLRRPVAATRAVLERSHQEVREIAQRLRPLALDQLGLANALAALAGSFRRDTGLSVGRHVDPQAAAALDEAQELAVYRIAQEAMTNAARHARPGAVELRLTQDGPDVVLRVTDDGSGRSNGHEGSGIRGMRERALLIGASVELRPAARSGTEVELRIPLR